MKSLDLICPLCNNLLIETEYLSYACINSAGSRGHFIRVYSYYKVEYYHESIFLSKYIIHSYIGLSGSSCNIYSNFGKLILSIKPLNIYNEELLISKIDKLILFQ